MFLHLSFNHYSVRGERLEFFEHVVYLLMPAVKHELVVTYVLVAFKLIGRSLK